MPVESPYLEGLGAVLAAHTEAKRTQPAVIPYVPPQLGRYADVFARLGEAILRGEQDLPALLAGYLAASAETRARVCADDLQYPVVVAQGSWRDVKHYPDGHVEATPWTHNLVVNVFANLVAGLLIGNGAGGLGATYSGVQYMAVGTGSVSWDTGGTPSPSLTDTQLLAELARKAVTAQFVDGTGAVVAGPTANVLVTCTFNVGEANGDLREWGLFGGNATATANSGIMIDRVTTTKLSKTAGINDFALTRLVTITL